MFRKKVGKLVLSGKLYHGRFWRCVERKGKVFNIMFSYTHSRTAVYLTKVIGTLLEIDKFKRIEGDSTLADARNGIL